MKQVDMSSEAVTRRLRRSSDLRDLCVSLMRAKRLYDEKTKSGALENDRLDRTDTFRSSECATLDNYSDSAE